MDLRVYVDGVVCIICDLTPTTTVHDVIIALAQYKGKTGRYSLIERNLNGIQRTLSPNELTSELINHPDWTYILRQNKSSSDSSCIQKRSKSLDGRKTPIRQQSIVESMLMYFDHSFIHIVNACIHICMSLYDNAMQWGTIFLKSD